MRVRHLKAAYRYDAINSHTFTPAPHPGRHGVMDRKAVEWQLDRHLINGFELYAGFEGEKIRCKSVEDAMIEVDRCISVRNKQDTTNRLVTIRATQRLIGGGYL